MMPAFGPEITSGQLHSIATNLNIDEGAASISKSLLLLYELAWYLVEQQQQNV